MQAEEVTWLAVDTADGPESTRAAPLPTSLPSSAKSRHSVALGVFMETPSVSRAGDVTKSLGTDSMKSWQSPPQRHLSAAPRKDRPVPCVARSDPQFGDREHHDDA